MLVPKLKPNVGLGIMVIREGKVLMAKRLGALGNGTWGFPGGKLEGLESFERGIMRELTEECGEQMKIKNLRFALVYNIIEAPKHFVTIGFVAEWADGEPINGEPNKHEEWQWFPIDQLPKPTFIYSQYIVEAYQSGQVYRDAKA